MSTRARSPVESRGPIDLTTGKPSPALHERTTARGRGPHTDSVTSLAFSPDGKTLVTGSRDKTVRLWDVAARRAAATYEGHAEGVPTVAFSPDGKTLASGSRDGMVKLWDLPDSKEPGD